MYGPGYRQVRNRNSSSRKHRVITLHVHPEQFFFLFFGVCLRRQRPLGGSRQVERCRHHMVNRIKGGSNHVSNCVLLRMEREKYLHLFFGNLNQYQILAQLCHMNESGIYDEQVRVFRRLIRAKRNQARLQLLTQPPW